MLKDNEQKICHPYEEEEEDINGAQSLEEETMDALAKVDEQKAENLSLIEQFYTYRKKNDELTQKSKVLEKK